MGAAETSTGQLEERLLFITHPCSWQSPFPPDGSLLLRRRVEPINCCPFFPPPSWYSPDFFKAIKNDLKAKIRKLTSFSKVDFVVWCCAVSGHLYQVSVEAQRPLSRLMVSLILTTASFVLWVECDETICWNCVSFGSFVWKNTCQGSPALSMWKTVGVCITDIADILCETLKINLKWKAFLNSAVDHIHPFMVAYACNPSTWEIEVGRKSDQPRLHETEE